MIKMIALDMDNTLLNSQKEISPRNEAVLKRLHEQGIKIVLCTGRPINAIWPYIEQLGLTTRLLLMAGWSSIIKRGLLCQNMGSQKTSCRQSLILPSSTIFR
jgi:HAD superfamily hydrolase (TIGR01484 family)